MHSKRMLPHLSIPNPLSSCFPSSKTLTPSPTEMTPITALSRMTCHMQDAGTAGIFLPQHILAQSQLFPQRTTTDHSVSPQGMASASLGSRTMSTHSRSGSSTSLRTPPFIRSRAPSPPSIVECHERGATESLLTDHHLNTPTCWNNESNERISNSGGTGQDAHPLQAHSQRSHAYATQSLLRHLSRSSSLVTSFMDASRKSIENNSLDAPCLSHERSQSSTGTQSCADHQSDATAFGESEYIENRVYISTHTRRKYTCGPASMDTRWPYPFRVSNSPLIIYDFSLKIFFQIS